MLKFLGMKVDDEMAVTEEKGKAFPVKKVVFVFSDEASSIIVTKGRPARGLQLYLPIGCTPQEMKTFFMQAAEQIDVLVAGEAHQKAIEEENEDESTEADESGE